jgi:hypothetical protein
MTSVDLTSLVGSEATAAVDQPMYVDGAWVEAADGARIEVVDPGTGEVFATVPDAAEADVDRAVAAARATFDGDEATTLAYFFEILGNTQVLIGTYQHRMRREEDRWRIVNLRIAIRYRAKIEAAEFGGLSLAEVRGMAAV